MRARAKLRHMWMGSIRLGAGDRSGSVRGPLEVVVLRDGVTLTRLLLDAPGDGVFTLPRIHDLTPQLPDGSEQDPLPYPPHGIEFAHGLRGHLALRLTTADGEAAPPADLEVAHREIRLVGMSFDRLCWAQDATWTPLESWTLEPAAGDPSASGLRSWRLALA